MEKKMEATTLTLSVTIYTYTFYVVRDHTYPTLGNYMGSYRERRGKSSKLTSFSAQVVEQLAALVDDNKRSCAFHDAWCNADVSTWFIMCLSPGPSFAVLRVTNA